MMKPRTALLAPFALLALPLKAQTRQVEAAPPNRPAPRVAGAVGREPIGLHVGEVVRPLPRLR